MRPSQPVPTKKSATKTTAKSATKTTAKTATNTTAKSATKTTTKSATKKTTKSAAKKTTKSATRSAAPRTADEIFAEVESRAAEVGVELRPGATAREIARTEQALGLSLPPDVRAWYARHDGTAEDAEYPFLWPLALIRDHRQYFVHLLEPHEFILGGIEDSVTYIDLSAAGAGRVFHFSAEDGPEQKFAGFLEWLVSFDWDWDLD
jgi:hypothetical protein